MSSAPSSPRVTSVVNQLIKYSYSTGELSPQFFGRSDLEQYDLGMAKAENWFVDFRGGLSNRPGLRFNEVVPEDVSDIDAPVRFFDFQFSDDPEDQYIVFFVGLYIYFIQGGNYILKEEADVLDVQPDGDIVLDADPDDVASGAFYVFRDVGGINEINSRMYKRRTYNSGTNTLTLNYLPPAVPGTQYLPTGTYTSGGKIYSVYRILSGYTSSDLAELRAYQHRDLIRLTHPDYPITNLIRNGHVDWEVSEEDIGGERGPPTGLQADESAAGNASLAWTVTAILRNGEETRYSQVNAKNGFENYSVVQGNMDFSWNTKADAVGYNVYRSNIVNDPGSKQSNGVPLGFIGTVKGTSLLDGNIVPDFGKSPPVEYDPFAPGAITYIEITNPGSGADGTTTISISGGGGTGFEGYPIFKDGEIIGAVITRPGRGYNNPTVSFGGAGTGQAAIAEARAESGTYPRVSTIFQQRQLYAGSDEFPLTIWGSKPKLYSNFMYSEITNEGDAYEFEIDSAQLNPIKHLEPQRGGLLVMSNSGVWQLTGGEQAAVTAVNVLADPQTYTGVSDVKPLKVDNNLIYVEGRGYGVRLLGYNEFSKVYSSDDKSVLSRHLFGVNKQVVDWCAATTPLKMVNCVRSDGAMLAFTIVAEEKVFSWTPWKTRGLWENCITIKEDTDQVYCVVKRYVNGTWVRFVESFAARDFETIEDAFFVDAGLTLEPNYPAADAVLVGTTLTADAAVFDVGCEDWIVRCRGGKLVITARTSSTVVTVQVITEIPELVEGAPNELAEGDWTLDEPVTTVGGLWHLEGQEVTVLADGFVVTGKVVTDGEITLDLAASRIHVGISYTATAQTLPPVVSDAVIENKRKRIVAVATRKFETVGLKTGSSLSKLRSFKERTTQPYNEATPAFTGLDPIWIDPEWNTEGQTYFVQDLPLPATLLGHIVEIEVGDDKR